MSLLRARHVSSRVEALIDRHHAGDRSAAARRLGIDPERLTGLLSGDWGQFTLDALAALLVGYDVSVDWLLATSGAPAPTTCFDHAP